MSTPGLDERLALSPRISEPVREPTSSPQGVGFWRRAAARIIDALVHNVVSALAVFGMWFVVGIIALLAGTSPAALTALADKLGRADFTLTAALLGSILGSLAYHAAGEAVYGSTLGKLILGIAVVKEDGSLCDWLAAIDRSSAFLIDGLFFGLVAAGNMSDSPLKQRLGDKWAHTVVVERNGLAPQQRRSGWLFLGALLAGCLLDGGLCAVAQLVRLL